MRRNRIEHTLFLILSLGYGGAEKRITKIADKFLTVNGGALLINTEQLKVAERKTLTKETLESLRSRGQLFTTHSHSTKSKILNRILAIFFSSIFLIRTKPTSVHLALGAILLAPVAKLLRCKVTIEITSPDNAKFVSKYGVFILPFTDNIVHVSTAVQEKLNLISNVPKRIKQVVYKHPYYEPLDMAEKEKESLVVFCARLIPRKNGLLFAESVKLALSKTKTPFNVKIMGDGVERKSIELLLKDEICDGLAVVGPHDNPIDILNSSLIFVSLIEPDNYPSQSVLEAMNCANYLILSDTPLSGKFINNNGVLVQANKVDISNAIVKAVENKDDTISSGKMSSEHLRTSFSPSKIIDTLQTVHLKKH